MNALDTAAFAPRGPRRVRHWFPLRPALRPSSFVPALRDHSLFPTLRALPLFALLLTLAGCTSSAPQGKPAARGPGSATRVDSLSLVTMPVAVSLDSRPGVNGIVVKVYAGDARHAKPQPIRTGTVEVLMFDGLVRESFERTNQCRHVWSFPAADLRAQLFTTTIGAGYSLQLGWGKDSPRQDKITVVARYLPPQGPPVYSAPSYIALPPPPTPSPPNTAAQTRRRPLPFTWLLYAAWRLHS